MTKKYARTIDPAWERRPVSLVVPMDYPGKVVSVNHCYRPNGRGGRVLEPEAKRWRADVTQGLLLSCLALGIRIAAFEEPITVRIDAHYIDEYRGTDPDNLRKLTNDGVKDCLGVDDRRYQPEKGTVEYGASVPSITITVTATVVIEP